MAIEKSGLYYPNKIARIYITSIQETVGVEAMTAILREADVPPELRPPPDDFAKEFDFAFFSGIGATLERMYGPRGERGLAIHAGRASFAKGLAEYGPVTGTRELAFKMIPIEAKLRVLLKVMAEAYSRFSDQKTTTQETETHFQFIVHKCPRCWGRTSTKAICYSGLGILAEGCSWVSGGKQFLVEQIACQAAGDETCVFQVLKTPQSDTEASAES